MANHLRKKIILWFIVFIMVFTMLPWGDMTAYAFDADKYYVDYIAITKIYNDGEYNVKQTKVTIRGRYLQGIPVGTMTSTGYKVLTNPNPNLDTVQEFLVDGDIVGNTIDVGNITIPIEQNELPTLLGVDKRSVKIGIDSLTLKGSYLSKIKDDPAEYTAYYENEAGAGGQIALDASHFTGNEVTIPADELRGVAGLQNIVLKKEKVVDVDFENNSTPNPRPVTVTIQNTYVKQFRLVDTIEVTNLVMNPNRGQPGDTISFIATSGLDHYDVFFLKNLTDKFTNDNKGQNTYFTPNVDGKQVLTTQVPPYKLGAIENGEYYVVLTNKIPENEDPNEAVNKQLVVGTPPNYEKFTVIDAEQKIKIFSVQPNKGPDTGSKVEISGVFFGSLNIPEFIPDDAHYKDVTMVSGSDETVMQVTYSGGTYKGINVLSAVRTIKVVIGSITKFAKKQDDSDYEYSFTTDLDKISVITPSVSDAETNPVKDIVIETETTFVLEGFPNNVIVKDRAELKDAYTFIPSKITPVIEDIIPAKIDVEKINDTTYEISEDRMMAIHGSNFFVHKYTKPDGTDEVRYPIVEIGREIRLNKNNDLTDPYADSNLYLKVFDEEGNEVDGTEGNEIGTKILVKIPAETSVTALGKTYVKVINPQRNSDQEGISDQKYDAVEFVSVSDRPVIESVEPNIVTVDGGQNITITGSNFQEGIKVFLDGEEISGVTRDINTQANKLLLTFTAPPGREGMTQLQVMNPDGGMDTADFTYVKTFNKDPQISGFSPNKGSHGTIVVVKGGNFLKPDPTTTSIAGLGIYRLIGTRILLDGKDINSYVKSGGTIILEEYAAPSGSKVHQLIYEDNGYVKAADYYHSVILEDASSGKYYTLNVDTKGTVILSDGVSNTYSFTKGIGTDTYEAVKNGIPYTIQFTAGDPSTAPVVPDQLIIQPGEADEVVLTVKTPYTTESKTIDGVTGHFITGNRVKVTSKGELYFTVPQLEVEKWYDVTVVNPDTKSSTKAGEQGFYYFKQPKEKPTITDIYPSQGSTEGGYMVTITGTNFEDNGIDKSQVIIGGVEVAPGDITVSTDGTQITFKVPPYPGDLQEEVETDRKTVPVVVVNTDGGNASIEDGFTYVLPTSHPKITKILPDRGTAAGGSIVQIFGADFRYFEPYKDANGNVQYDPGEAFENLNHNEENGMPKWDNLEGMEVSDLTEEDKNILPKIYFGNKPGEILEFADGYLVVKTPAGVEGAVDVYVVNNDHGISNKAVFTYESSNPEIASIIPQQGKKQGKDKIEINGIGFALSTVDIYNDQTDNDGNTLFDTRQMALVRFGDAGNENVSNREIPIDQPNGGRIINGSAKVTVGNLTVDYDAAQTPKTLTFTITEEDKIYQKLVTGYDDTVKYVSLDTLRNQDSAYEGYEMVRIEVDAVSRKLYVERGYAPYHTNLVFQPNQLVLYTPSYYTIGRIPVVVINPDGGRAEDTFEYKNPDSTPRITNITKEGRPPVEQDGARILEMTYKGGNIVSVIGDDFRENAKIQISDILTIEPKDIEYDSLPTKLTFTMPEVPESAAGKLHRVIVINEDGGIAASDEALPTPLYIKFIKGETTPAIEKIVPDKGPSAGGTKVTIYGRDFREEIEGKKLTVYFGEVQVPEEDVTVVDYKTIIVYTPSHEPGKVPVKIENPDGELADPVGEFTYLSTPKIIAVVDPNDPQENTRITTISVEGGQQIKLKGSNYLEGARVLFAPVVQSITDEASAKGEVVYIDGQPYDLQAGTEGTDVRFIDEETLTVKVPQGKLDTTGIIVVNPDGGASNVYEDIQYGLPEISAPTGVVAELIYDRYIKVNWTGVTGAKEYEIYVVINHHEREFVGNTELTSFVYEDLEPNTSYRFIIKAVGDFGSSKPSQESNTVKTGRRTGPPDDDGELGEKNRFEKIGNLAQITIGTKDCDEKEIIIDLTKGSLAGSKEVVIGLPAAVVADIDAKDVTVIGQDFRIKFNPKAFYTSQVKENAERKDAGVRFWITPADVSTLKGSSGQTILSTPYHLKATLFIGPEQTEIEYLRSSLQITFDVDIAKAALRKVKAVYLSLYDAYDRVWLPIASGEKDDMALTGLSDKLGKFAMIGSRR